MDGIVVFCNGSRGGGVLRAIAQAGHGASRVFVPLSRTHQDAIVDAWAAACTTLEAVEDVNSASFVRAFRATSTQLLLVAGFSSILREPLLSCAAHDAINLHAGRLPEYRGGSPLNWQIINGESTAGLSVIRLDQGIDRRNEDARCAVPSSGQASGRLLQSARHGRAARQGRQEPHQLDELSCHGFRKNEVCLQLHMLAYNMGNFLRTLALPDEIEHWPITTMREKLLKIGAKVVRHGRFVTFQLAGVAIPRRLFAEILRLIDGLRPRPSPT